MQRNLLRPPPPRKPPYNEATRMNRRLRYYYLSWALFRRRLALWTSAILIGVAGILFMLGSRAVDALFLQVYAVSPWLSLAWTPAFFVLSIWLIRTVCPDAGGGGISQTIAALDRRGAALRDRVLTLKAAGVKLVAPLIGIGAGGTFGYEGPIVHVGAALTYAIGKFNHITSEGVARSLILAGGAAGVAAAFNTPLAGIVFAIEEMHRGFEHRASGVMLIAVILSGLVTMAVFGNYDYYGVASIHFRAIGTQQIVAVILTGLICGGFGGLTARMLLAISSGSTHWIFRQRTHRPYLFAGSCGLAIAVIGLSTHGLSFGTGYEQAKLLLEGGGGQEMDYFGITKLCTLVLSQLSGVTGGMLAPSLTIGAGFGHDIGRYLPEVLPQAMVLLGMVGYFAGLSRSPLTGLVVVMEMTDSSSMVIPLMVTALLASGVSRQICRQGLYDAQARLLLLALRREQQAAADKP